MPNKKIYMVLTNGFDPDVRVYKEAKYLESIGNDVEILCWDRKCEYINRQNEKIDGIIVKRFPIKSTPETGMKQIIPFLKFMLTIKKQLRHVKDAYIHCHDFDGILTGIFANGHKKNKVIFDIHEIYKDYAYGKLKFFNKLYRYVIKKSNYIIYVADEQIKDMGCDEKSIFLPNYPIKGLYEPVAKDKKDRLRINYVGSVRDVDSLYTLVCLDDKYSVGVYGMGSGYDKLVNLLNNQQKKRIYGKYDGVKESGKIYRNTDILYCVYNPDVYNWRIALPVKLFEALVTNTPIIGAKGTELSKFIEEKKIGESVTYGDKSELENAINVISNNYESYIKNIESISREYQWETIEKNLLKIYGG